MASYLLTKPKRSRKGNNMNNLKIVFMGTPDFAVPCLKTLNENYEVIAVITQPDRPKGRGQKLTPSPIKEYALEHTLTVLQPEKLNFGN